MKPPPSGLIDSYNIMAFPQRIWRSLAKGYSSPETVGLVEPMQIAMRYARRMGAIAGTIRDSAGFRISFWSAT